MVFILLCLAVWRLTHLISKEDGPFDIIYRIRKAAGAGFFGSLLDCFYCVSIWVAAPFGLYAGNGWFEKILYWLSLSGAACLLEQATTHSNNTPPELPDYKED
ncbi:DUF1360 domain-containing protein [Niabella soli]|uniref:DUF1360 domain-containing protein n=1 Tax=Niabella soli DSM 19437 TaxID=929713 RepID=W0F8P6_9BACT|nr:DUF1360 domain-containing protein [Niabella soli]AHF17731.1 hypothetical protein NIASO_13260 [Niabella soli DSM 19437]